MRRLDRFGLWLPVLLLSVPVFGAAPEVKTVPGLGGDAAAAHDVLAGRPTTLKGTASVSGAEIQATWEFGDGSEPFVFTVANGYDVSARHTYSGQAGTAYTAKLTVVDLRSGESSSARYLVKIGENTLAVGAAIAIDEGLWYLHRTMNRTTGDWQGDCGRACNASGSVTASNVLAFEAAGFLATGDASNPYTETVERGLRTLVRSTDPALRTGDWVRALEAADTPERVVENGPADLMGRTFGEIVNRTLETQNLKAKASGARAAAASVALEEISSLIGRQNPAGYWTNGSDEAQASFETASALFAVASNFRSVASTISIVSSQVQVTSTGFLFSRVTQTFNGTMTVKNISGSAIAGPIVVVLTNLPVGVTLANGNGVFNGSPYIVVPSVTLLSPGQSASVALRFANPGNVIINFVPVTYSGTFPPDPVSVGCPANTGTNGTPYNSAILGNGGVLPYTFSIAPGSLPGGLTLNAATGAITGSPSASGLFTFTANVADGTGVPSGTASASCSINVSGSTVAVTVQTAPAGLSIVVDGTTYTAPQVFNWTAGTNHTIATTTPQGSGGTRYVFNNWSDGLAISHAVTAPGSATTYTATFDTEYQLTTAAGAGGTVTPASGSFYLAGTVVNVAATANSGFVFANWTGPVADANSAATTVTMSAPVSVTANFTANTAITVQTVPAGLSIVVDGTTYTAPQSFNWTPGSNHTIATTTPQGSGGTRYVFNNWSDGLAISHSVTAPGSATTYTANFDTEYQLTTAAGAGGTVSPASGSFYAAGTVVNVAATANSGFVFANWTGPVADANSAATTVTMSAPVSVTANFTANTAITVQTVPAGLSIVVDGTTYTAPQSFNWTPGSNHTIATTTPQGSGGTRYVFNNWSDGLAISHSVTAPGSATTYTANFDTQYQLTVAASPANGGTVTPVSGTFFAAGSVQSVTATANSGFVFANWTGPVASANSAATTVTMSAPVSVTANFTANTAITVQTVPAGLSVVVDGTTYTAPQSFNWTPGSNHTIATTTPQGSGGTRYVFNNWSDGLAISHSVTAPGSATTYTATFDTQYQLTTAASPANGGTVTPATGTFFAAGSVQNISATANSGFVFANWTGPVASANSAATTVTMSAPVSVTANFTATVAITVQTAPAGLSIVVDGNTLTAPQTFNWTPGSNHTIATTTPQGSGGTRYVFNNWSDGLAISHAVVAPGSATTYTANFNTEYQLTTVAGSGGTVTPASGSFFAAGSVQNVTATPNSGFAFNGWTGPVASTTSAATTVTMSGPVTVTAAFATLLTVACPATTTVNIGTPYSDSLAAAGGTPGYTYSLQSGTLPPPLALTPGTGLISGTPTTKGTYNFVGKVVDTTSPIQQTATANCSILVPNRAPAATGQVVSTNEDTAKSIILAGSDADGDALTFTIVTPPAKGTLSAPGAVSCSGVPSSCTRGYTYTPTANLNGPDSFTFKVNDGNADSVANGTVSITINAVNDAPVATAKPYNGFANMRITIPAVTGLLVGATDPGDPENASPVFTVGTVSATSPAGGTVSVNQADGSFNFDPPPGVTGNVTFTYTVCDNGVPTPAACSAAATVTVNVSGPVIWFVNTAGGAGAGNGTLFTPFNTLGLATTAMGSNTNQRIFVYSGIQALGAGVTLPTDGRLIGQGVTGASFDAVMGITPPVTAIARPAINGTAPVIRGTVNMNGNNVQVRGVSIQPGSGVAALAATQAGPFTGLVVSDIPNIGTSGAARAVDLRNVSGTISITSVNASGADIGINLSDINPASGSFTVAGGTGTCSVATPTCSGGTISNVTDTSVKLTNAKNVSLTRMRLANSPNFGLNGNNVTGLAIDTCLIDGTHGTTSAIDEGALYVTNWLGTGTISNSHITGGANDNIRVVNNTGVLNRLTISNSTITNPIATSNHGLRFATDVASNAGAGVVMNLTVSGTTFRNNRSNHFDSGATGLSTMDIVLNNNTFVTDGGFATLAGAINITNDHQSDVTFDLNGNTSTGAQTSAVNFFTSNATTNAASMIGKFRNNTIGTAGVTNSGSVAGNGLMVNSTGLSAVTMNITGNTIRNWGGNYGMDVASGQGGSPTVNFTATGNILNLNVPNAVNNLTGMHFNMGTTAAGVVTACVDAGGAGGLVNTLTGSAPAGNSELRVRQRNSSTVRLPGFTTGTAATYLFGRNTASNAAAVTTSGTFSGGAACTQAP